MFFFSHFKHVDVSESTDHDDALQGKNKKIKILMTELEVSLKFRLEVFLRIFSLICSYNSIDIGKGQFSFKGTIDNVNSRNGGRDT